MYILLSISKDGASGEAVKPEMEKPAKRDYPGILISSYRKYLKEYEDHLQSLPRLLVDLTNSKLKVGERFDGYEQVLLSYGQGSTWYNLDEVKDSDSYEAQSYSRTLQARLIPEQPGKGEEETISIPLKNVQGSMTVSKDASHEVIDAVNKMADLAFNKLAHPSQEAPEQGEVKYELGKGLQAKVDFYREQTEKIRTWLDENKIGNPCQGFFDAVLEHLQSLTTPSLARHEAERRYPILSDDKNEIAIVESDRVNFLAGFEYRDGMGGEKESAEVFFDIYFDKNDNVATLTKFAIIEFAELYHKRNFPAPSLPAEQGKWVSDAVQFAQWLPGHKHKMWMQSESKEEFVKIKNTTTEEWYEVFKALNKMGELLSNLPASPQTK